MKILLPSSTFRKSTWECEAFLAASMYSYHLHRGLAGQECDLSYIYIPALPSIPHLPKGGWRDNGLTLA